MDQVIVGDGEGIVHILNQIKEGDEGAQKSTVEAAVKKLKDMKASPVSSSSLSHPALLFYSLAFIFDHRQDPRHVQMASDRHELP
jgi:hypothetical protein